MKFITSLLLIGGANWAAAQGFVGAGVGLIDMDGSRGLVGNSYNYWETWADGTVDLTRRAVAPVTSPFTVPMTGMRPAAVVEPSRSVLCVIDMQNYFLHPGLAPGSVDGRAAVGPVADLARAFRAARIPVAWVNWGLNDFDLLMLPPSVKSGGFSHNESMGEVFDAASNRTVDAGPRLMAGTWNVEPYGELKGLVEDGVRAGTDLLFNKNRLSALWGAQTPFGLWLQERQITTIFLAGVDADQCVRSTMMDGYFKGFDVIYVDDVAATGNGEAAYENTRLTANYTSFIAQSCDIISAL